MQSCSPEIEVGETWKPAENVPLHNLELEGTKMTKLIEILIDAMQGISGQRLIILKTVTNLVSLKVELPQCGAEVPAIVLNVVNLKI